MNMNRGGRKRKKKIQGQKFKRWQGCGPSSLANNPRTLPSFPPKARHQGCPSQPPGLSSVGTPCRCRGHEWGTQKVGGNPYGAGFVGVLTMRLIVRTEAKEREGDRERASSKGREREGNRQREGQ